MESQSADAEPPPPPKPELRYPVLSRTDTEGETSTHNHIELKIRRVYLQVFQHWLTFSDSSVTFGKMSACFLTLPFAFLAAQRAAC